MTNKIISVGPILICNLLQGKCLLLIVGACRAAVGFNRLGDPPATIDVETQGVEPTLAYIERMRSAQ